MSKLELNTHNPILLDSASLARVKEWSLLVGGVTTNPIVLEKAGVTKDRFYQTIQDISQVMGSRPVFVQLRNSPSSVEAGIEEGVELSQISDSVVVKVPVSNQSNRNYEVMRELAYMGISVCATAITKPAHLDFARIVLCGAPSQTFVSLLWGRSLEEFDNSDESGHVKQTPSSIISQSLARLPNSEYNSKILVGSVRQASVIDQAFAAGANFVTATPEILEVWRFGSRSMDTIREFNDAWDRL